jgi:hypothetical protein
MTAQPRLTQTQKQEVCSIVQLGCDRVTACWFLGLEPEAMQRELAEDLVFARQVRRAAAEIQHMSCLREASQSGKQWRVAQWWLERRAPDRYGARRAGSITQEHMDLLVDRVAQIIVDEVKDDELVLRILKLFIEAARRAASQEASDGGSAREEPSDEMGAAAETALMLSEERD